MSVGEILHVNIVADRGPIGRLKIASKHVKRIAPKRRRQCKRNDMRLGFVPLANFTVPISAGSVEISECNRFEAKGRHIVSEHSLDEELRPAVRVDWIFR